MSAPLVLLPSMYSFLPYLMRHSPVSIRYFTDPGPLTIHGTVSNKMSVTAWIFHSKVLEAWSALLLKKTHTHTYKIMFCRIYPLKFGFFQKYKQVFF